MKVVADLHLHSKYSRAVSQQMEPKTMALWAVKKGIDLLGTADWTHPLWLKELEANLEEKGEGIYRLKNGLLRSPDDRAEVKTNFCSVSELTPAKLGTRTSTSTHKNCLSPRSDSNSSSAPPVINEPSFLLSTEISSIYSQEGKVHRIHNVVLAPSFTVVHKINEELKRRGCNLLSDGRPIIGLSSINLCELLWSIDKNIMVIPAHAWTPWFSLYGSKSGFDSIDECFGEFSNRIYAVETGLSSDPAMNWRIKELDNRSIVSFSDAHSPAKMGRELTVFELEELSYKNITAGLTTNLTRDAHAEVKTNFCSVFESPAKDTNQNLKSSAQGYEYKNTHKNYLSPRAYQKFSNRILYTIEFHPEEGKYHYTGHRNCGIKQTPEETNKKGTTCPVCGRPLTVGVMHRVEELAKGKTIKIVEKTNEAGLVGYYNGSDLTRPPYVMLVPLMEILAESLYTSTASQKVINEYNNLTENLGLEIDILTRTKLEEIEKISGARVAEGINKVRKGNIVVDPGFDGVFGTVKIWAEKKEEQKTIKEQMSLL